MGGWGSGRRKEQGRKTVGSCWELDANYLSAKGCLEPGWSGTWQGTNNAVYGNEVYSINLRAEAGQLYLSWHSRRRGVAGRNIITGEGTDGGGTDGEEKCGDVTAAGIIPIVHVPCRFGGSRPYFVCPGTVISGTGSGTTNASTGAAATATTGCGRRVIKLYLSNRYFLCRHCSGLVYASPYEQPWQRAYRRAHRLQQRLGSSITGDGSSNNDAGMTTVGVPKKPKGMSVPAYARLLEAALQAEIRAYDAGTAHIQQLAACIENRRRKRNRRRRRSSSNNKPKFTL